MTTNQSRKERIARVVAGLWLLKSGRKLGLVPLVTGITGYCPVKNKLFGSRFDRTKACHKK